MVEKLQEKIEKVKEAVKRCGLDSECVGCPYENQHCSELDRDIITVIDCLEAYYHATEQWLDSRCQAIASAVTHRLPFSEPPKEGHDES